jgi:hypothetical protein
MLDKEKPMVTRRIAHFVVAAILGLACWSGAAA